MLKITKYLTVLPLLVGTTMMALGLTAAAEDNYKIGVTNTVQGNGWREEMICAIKAEALAPARSPSSTSRTATPTPPASSRTSAT